MEEGISYHLIKEEGPDHNKSFTVEVKIGETVYGTGSGRTEKSSGTGSRLQGNSEAEKTKLKRVFYVFKMY